jgi:hypothetical protein
MVPAAIPALPLALLLGGLSAAAGGWFSDDDSPPPPPPARQARWGIMGTAKIARKLAWSIEEADNSVLTAVASRDVSKAVQFTTQHTRSTGHARFYGDYADLVKDPDVDVIYIPLPTALSKV